MDPQETPPISSFASCSVPNASSTYTDGEAEGGVNNLIAQNGNNLYFSTETHRPTYFLFQFTTVILSTERLAWINNQFVSLGLPLVSTILPTQLLISRKCLAFRHGCM